MTIGPHIARQFYWLTGAAGGLYSFGVLSTVRASSYNTIALSAAVFATALIMRGIDAKSGRSRFACVAAYGFVMGICGLSEGSTGFLVGCLHLAYSSGRIRGGIGEASADWWVG